MKCHTGVDAGSGFVHTVEAAANVHDVTVASKLLREDDEVVYGDSAYLGLEKREEIKNIVISLEKHLKERYNTGMSYPVKYRERTIEYREEGHTLEETSKTFKVAVSTIR